MLPLPWAPPLPCARIEGAAATLRTTARPAARAHLLELRMVCPLLPSAAASIRGSRDESRDDGRRSDHSACFMIAQRRDRPGSGAGAHGPGGPGLPRASGAPILAPAGARVRRRLVVP